MSSGVRSGRYKEPTDVIQRQTALREVPRVCSVDLCILNLLHKGKESDDERGYVTDHKWIEELEGVELHTYPELK